MRVVVRRHVKLRALTTFPAFVGVFDGAVPGAVLPQLEAEALALWAESGGSRSSAKSFWVDARSRPTSALGALATAVVDAHFAGAARAAVRGAEVWVQLRDGSSPATRGLEFHFDKCERSLAERDDWRHPALATATYLTDSGAPLVVFDTTSDGGGDDARPSPPRGWIVAPRRARHVAFAGDRLHGVPDEIATDSERESDRLSILVNVWTDFKPLGLGPLPSFGGDAIDLALDVDRERTRVWLPLERISPDSDTPLFALREHREGDTGLMPTPLWRAYSREAAAALELRYLGA